MWHEKSSCPPVDDGTTSIIMTNDYNDDSTGIMYTAQDDNEWDECRMDAAKARGETPTATNENKTRKSKAAAGRNMYYEAFSVCFIVAAAACTATGTASAFTSSRHQRRGGSSSIRNSSNRQPITATLAKVPSKRVFSWGGGSSGISPSSRMSSIMSTSFQQHSYHPSRRLVVVAPSSLTFVVEPSHLHHRNHHNALFSSSSDTTEEIQNKSSISKPDDREWNTLLAAFQMYKAAYGDLKVPSRFVVPAMPPWPEAGWGLKLGQRVAAIRSTGKFVQDDDDRRKVLDDMGFLWRLRAPSPDKNMDVSFDQIYDALVTYRNECQPDDNPLNVPANFIVPSYDPWPETTRGMPLGKKIPTVRSKAYLKANPTATEKLEKIGFQFDGKVAANDARFNNVYDALVRYQELNGDLLVPQPFIVPENSDEWPEEVWGLRLGARVNAIRSQGTFVKTNPQRRKQLDDLGFEWELPPSATGKKRGRKKKSEIEALSGPAPPGLLLSSDGETDDQDDADGYVEEDTLSSPTAGDQFFGSPNSAFGDDFFQIRDNEKATNAASIGGGGGIDGAPSWGFEDEEAEQLAAAQQQALEDEYRPPKDLNQTLTRAAEMAMSVGVIESLGGGKRVVKGKIHKAIPWFNDDFGDDFVFEDVVEALTVYKTINGNFDGLGAVDENKEQFVVPEPSYGGDIDVEASARAAAAITQAEIRGDDNSDELIAAEIERMEMELLTARSSLDESFGSASDEQWPEHLAGMKLGSIVSRIRDGSLEVKHLPERKQQLDAIDFDWGDSKKFIDVPFEKAMCAMFAYFLVRGDLFVYEDFVMPGDQPWPSVLAGFELGKAVRRIRELQNFFEAYHPEKVQLLRKIEFMWFPELALPLNPEEGEESWEDMYVEGVGHPFYHLNEPSVAMLDNLQAQGPSGPEGKTKSWYNYDEVADYWKKGDLVDSGKDDRFGTDAWNPAEFLYMNGFSQLSAEHEARYGSTPGLELIRLVEQYHDGEISEAEFDEVAASAIQRWQEEELRDEAIAAGIEIEDDDDFGTILERIKADPEYRALDEDPEYQKLIQAEMDAEAIAEAEEQTKLKIEEVVEEEVDEDDDEEDDEDDEFLDEDFEDDDDDDYEFEDEDEDGDENEDDEADNNDDDDDDFGIDEEDI